MGFVVKHVWELFDTVCAFQSYKALFGICRNDNEDDKPYDKGVPCAACPGNCVEDKLCGESILGHCYIVR